MNDFFQLIVLYVRPGRAEQLRQELIALVEPSRRDAGNLRYEVFADHADPRRFIFLEHWATAEAQQKHHTETDHIRRFEERKDDMVDKVELFYRMTPLACVSWYVRPSGSYVRLVAISGVWFASVRTDEVRCPWES